MSFYKKIDHIYKKNSKTILISLLILGILFTIFQSWIIEPTNFDALIQRTWVIPILIIPIILVFIFDNRLIYAIIGIIYLIFATIILFTDFLFIIDDAYGIISVCIAVWLLSDFFNMKFHNKSIISELIKGNFRLLLCLFFVSFVIGWLIETVTEPIKFWTYYYPIPSLIIGNVYFITLMGWVPWILCLLSPFFLVTMFKSRKKSKFFNDISKKYKNNSKKILILLIILLSLITTLHSWFVISTESIYFIQQLFPLWLFSLLVIFIWIFPRPKFYFFIGIILILFGLLITFTDIFTFVNKPYGILYFATGLWPVFDFFNMKINKRSVIKELLEGNLTLLIGIYFISNFIATFIEFFNFQVKLWSYVSPIPGIDYNYAFGWSLWWLTAAIFLFIDVNDLSRP